MGLREDLFSIGDWVIVDSGFTRDWTGYIVKYDFDEDRYKVRLTRDDDGKATDDFNKWFDSDQLMPTNVFLKREDIITLIDLAIDTKDKKWFEELTLQLTKGSMVV